MMLSGVQGTVTAMSSAGARQSGEVEVDVRLLTRDANLDGGAPCKGAVTAAQASRARPSGHGMGRFSRGGARRRNDRSVPGLG